MTESPTSLADLARLLEEYAGLVFPRSREGYLEAGARRAMARAGIADVRDFVARAQTDAALLDDLVGEVTIGETYFFREPGHFEFIREQVLPEALARPGASRPLRLWSAACASGEEAYSLAVLLDEEGLGDHASILATDVSRPALARARRAIYTAWSLRGMDPRRVERCFRRDGPSYHLDERLRRRVTFEYLNLALDAWPSLATGTWGLDLILCRNALIYFGKRAVERVALRLYESLADGGWLLTGPSDPLLGHTAPFDTIATPHGIVYRKRPPHETVVPVSRTPETRDAVGELEAAPSSAVPPPPVPAPPHDRPSEADRIRALANERGPIEAATEAALACAREPLSSELRYLRGMLLWAAGRDVDAARELRRALYLDPQLATVHFALGAVLERSARLAAMPGS